MRKRKHVLVANKWINMVKKGPSDYENTTL